jgi:hypothetical protein
LQMKQTFAKWEYKNSTPHQNRYRVPLSTPTNTSVPVKVPE